MMSNAPFIIEKQSGQIYITGTSQSINYYVQNFKKYGKVENKNNTKNDGIVIDI